MVSHTSCMMVDMVCVRPVVALWSRRGTRPLGWATWIARFGLSQSRYGAKFRLGGACTYECGHDASSCANASRAIRVAR